MDIIDPKMETTFKSKKEVVDFLKSKGLTTDEMRNVIAFILIAYISKLEPDLQTNWLTYKKQGFFE